MVGVLIVSHSAQIADGVRELAVQMAGADVPIMAVGGTGDGGLGTDAAKIRAVAAQFSTTDGFVVLLDLGSAVLSTEMALETMDTPHVISNAPLDQVAAAAEQARHLQKVQP